MEEESRTRPLTYRDAGVDIDAGNELIRRLAPLARSTRRAEVVSGIGGFAGMSALPPNIEDPLLVSGADGVGTKLKVAFAAGEHETVGIDLVAMGVNDILTVGAEPLFFLDYLAMGKLEVEVAEAVVSGVARGCQQAGCALLGGETAEMPGMYAAGEYDLAGFAVGVVARKKVIDGSRVKPGDAVIGLPSSGLHSNGYSLARKVLLEAGEDVDLHRRVSALGRSLAAELLEPTRIYAGSVKALVANVEVRALAHITGGGLVDNPPRCVPAGLTFQLDTQTWNTPAVMTLIAERGCVPRDEMYRTFNMGLGLLAVVPADQAADALAAITDDDGRVVGRIVASDGAAGDAVELSS